MKFRPILAFALISSLAAPAHSQQGPAPPNNTLEHARKQVDAGDFADANTTVAGILAQQPGSPDALYLRGYLFFRQHRYTESLESYTAAAALKRPSPDDLVVVASDYIFLADYPDAERWLRYATEQAPQNATAWYLLGRTQYLQDHDADALSSFQRCLALRPHDLRALYNQGLALERLQRPADALAAYRKAVEWERSTAAHDPQPYLNLGTLLLSQGQVAAAVDTLTQATERGPQNALCFQQLGRALEAAGHDREAATAYRRAIALAPDAERPHFFLGRLLRRLGEIREADTELATVSRLYGNKSSAETPNPDTPPTTPSN